MQILVISDVHANLTALEAVLSDAGEFDTVWFLGDLVGYGPDPNECIDRIRALPGLVALLGNHDAATLAKLNVDTFNAEARQAVYWTRDNIEPENLEYLDNLPSLVEVTEDITLAHGSPRQPIWEYIINTRSAAENFHFFDTPFCFVGHTHLPSIFRTADGSEQTNLYVPLEGVPFALSKRMILNPGSVGQPRDRDPRAAYALYNPENNQIQFKRVGYDVLAVQERMRTAGLPERHIDRLRSGW